MKQIRIAAMPHVGGFHVASWRRPDSRADDPFAPEIYFDLARIAERGKLDALFFGDSVALWPLPEEFRYRTARLGAWDALVMAGALAAVTKNIGIVATAHTEFHEPFVLARQFASLDRISHGRIGWNVVTSGLADEQANFSAMTLAPPAQRYERAAEFVDVVKGLWDSWEDDVLIVDRESGVYYDPAKLHVLDHHGKYYDVRGPLNMLRPLQGHPVIAQAGGSAAGKALAGSIGELIFTTYTGETAKTYSREVRDIAQAAGRDPAQITILGTLMPVVAATQEEAEAKWQFLQDSAPPELANTTMELMLGAKLSSFKWDEPLPQSFDEPAPIEALRNQILGIRNPDGSLPTVEELTRLFKAPGIVVGTPELVADYMEAEVDSGAVDGFMILLQGLPDELADFVDLVVPELQQRGRFRKEYDDDGTLRGRLGLSRPENRFAVEAGNTTSLVGECL